MLLGLAHRVFSHGWVKPGMRRFDTREAGQARLGLRADAGRAFVANLAAGAGRGTGERRDRRRMVVRLHLHQDVRRLARARR